jgi:hypothetical protein
MPGYRSQPLVADNIDAIYAYLVALPTGTRTAPTSSAASGPIRQHQLKLPP